MICNNFSSIRWPFVVLISVALVLLIPNFGAAILMNAAQIQMMRDDRWQISPLLMQAYNWAPHNPHVQWRTGVALNCSGQIRAAKRVLLPLRQKKCFDPAWTDSILATYMDIGQTDEALRLYHFLEYPPRLSQWVAATLLYSYLAQQQDFSLSEEQLSRLLSQALDIGITTADFRLFSEWLGNPNSWTSDERELILGTLLWRSYTGATHMPSWCCRENLSDNAFAGCNVSESQLRLLVSNILGAPLESVNFGEELVVNGSFEIRDCQSDIPMGWKPIFMTGGDIWNRAVFVVGTDEMGEFRVSRALRIDGLVVENLSDYAPAQAGFTHNPISVDIGNIYLISFSYRSKDVDGKPFSLWISKRPNFFGERFFPATEDGQWNQVLIIVQSQDEVFKPILRFWREGNVWVDDFSVREVILESEKITLTQDVLIQVREGIFSKN